LQPDPTDLDGAHTYVYANDDPVDLIEVGGAFSVSGFFHHAVEFLDSAAHVTFKVAEVAWNAVAGDDVHVICCTSYPLPIKALAVLDLAITVVPGADAGKTDSKVAADLSDNALRDAFRARKTGGSSALRDAEKAVGCALCFPAGTLVTTAHGEHAIQTLHVGDSVQAENPATGKVEAEAVQAVIADPVSPLIAVDLSDGSAITVTADHPFWVDGGAQLAGAGWFAAGSLRAGDELRTATGTHVMVVGLRRNVGTAVVYTLTVAKDHTFFVGSAHVLVHNTDSCPNIVLMAAKAAELDRGGVLTKAGRALAKHGSRPNSAFISTLRMSASEINQTARDIVEDILTHPQSTLVRSERARYEGEVFDVIAPDGRGLRYGSDGHFIGLLEPAR